MFNTLKYARKLEAIGLPRDQAEAHIQIIAEIIEGDLVTKQDLKDLEHRLVIKLTAIFGSTVTVAIAAFAAIAKML